MVCESSVSCPYCSKIAQDKRHQLEILCVFPLAAFFHPFYRGIRDCKAMEKIDFTTRHCKCLLSLPRFQKGGGGGEDFFFSREPKRLIFHTVYI